MRKYTLKELRKRTKQTQEKIANAIGINRALYSHYENGIRIPRVDVASNLAKYFGVKVEEIIFLNNCDTKRHKNIAL